MKAQLSLERGRVLVPSETVQTGPQGKYVWIMKPNETADMRPVQVVRIYNPPGSAEQSVIGSGLSAGEQVISEGQLRLMPGAHVQLLKSNSSAG